MFIELKNYSFVGRKQPREKEGKLPFVGIKQPSKNEVKKTKIK